MTSLFGGVNFDPWLALFAIFFIVQGDFICFHINFLFNTSMTHVKRQLWWALAFSSHEQSPSTLYCMSSCRKQHQPLFNKNELTSPPQPTSARTAFSPVGEGSQYTPCFPQPGRRRGRARCQVPQPVQGFSNGRKGKNGGYIRRIDIRIRQGVLRPSSAESCADKSGQARHQSWRAALAQG